MAIQNAVNNTYACASLTGTLQAAQMPALTGDVTTPGTSLATTLATVNTNVGSFTAANITVNGKGLITAAANGTATYAPLPITVVTSTTQAALVNNSYVANNASLVTVTLPTTAVIGSVINVGGFGAGGWLIAQNSAQLIHFGNAVTSTGAGGSLASTNAFDNITIQCVVANTTWLVLSAIGNITVV